MANSAWSQLIGIYTVCNGRVYPGSEWQGLTDWLIMTLNIIDWAVKLQMKKEEQKKPKKQYLFNDLGPVVQSVISLMSSLRVILLTVLADSIYNILIFFAEKMWVAFALQKLLTFFQQKISAYLPITRCKF